MKISGAVTYAALFLNAALRITRFNVTTSLKYAVPAALWGFTNNIAFYQYLLDPAAVTVLQNMKIPATAVLLKVATDAL